MRRPTPGSDSSDTCPGYPRAPALTVTVVPQLPPRRRALPAGADRALRCRRGGGVRRGSDELGSVEQAQGPGGSATDDTVGGQTVAGLEVPDRTGRAGAEAAVDDDV